MTIKRKHSEKGAAMVEYGLAFLLFFITVYAIMEFGRFIYSYNILAGATREASRYAIVHGSDSGAQATSATIQAKVREWAIGLDTSQVSVTTTWNPVGAGAGATVSVVSTYSMSPMTGLILRNPITIGSSSQMVISQ